MRMAVLLAASCLASACATRSLPPAEPAPRPGPDACDPRLSAEPSPEPAVLGGIVQPVTTEERTATAAFLEGEAEARAWGREGWRAQTSRGARALDLLGRRQIVGTASRLG